MDKKIYRETLFNRALERLVTDGGFTEAYLVNGAGLVWASTFDAGDQERFGVMAAAVAEIFSRAESEGLGRVRDLVVRREGGGAVVFYRFRHTGETSGEYFVAAVSDGNGGDTDLVYEVAEEIKKDLEAFY